MNRTLLIAIMAVVAILLTSCEKEDSQPVPYENDGISFSHFSDWSVEKDGPVEGKVGIRSISLRGPDSAVMVVLRVPRDTDQTLEDFADAVAQRRGAAIESTLQVGSFKAATADIGTSKHIEIPIGASTFPAIRQNFSIVLLGQESPHEATFVMLLSNKAKLLIMTQVGTRHSSETKPSFQKVLDTLDVDHAKWTNAMQ
ncbi:MAG TPA: hypothetical protein VIF82_16850 [Burkholderiaceae bacterium]|jgi:hypothetical protein